VVRVFGWHPARARLDATANISYTLEVGEVERKPLADISSGPVFAAMATAIVVPTQLTMASGREGER